MKPLILLPLLLLIGCGGPKYAKVGTRDLRLRHSQVVEALGPNAQSDSFSYTPPGLAGLAFRNPKEERFREKQEIEQELHRRYRAGDTTARLPIFDK